MFMRTLRRWPVRDLNEARHRRVVPRDALYRRPSMIDRRGRRDVSESLLVCNWHLWL